MRFHRSDMVEAFRYVFGAAALMLATAAVLFGMMEERPLRGRRKNSGGRARRIARGNAAKVDLL